MKITRLKLAAFRSYFGADLNTNAKIVYIAGLNGAGKSSILDSVKWGLTGRCSVTDGKGAGADALSPQGFAEKAWVELDLEGVGTVSRRLPDGLSVSGWTGTGPTQQGALYDRLAPSAFVDAVLDSGAYLGLHHADAKALVLSLLDVKLQLGETVYTLEQWDGLYDKAFGDRKVAKQRLKDFRMPAAPPDQPRPTLEQVDAQLAKLRGEVEGLLREVGNGSGQRAALLRQQAESKVREVHRASTPYEKVVADLEDAEERLALLEPETKDALSPAAGRRLQLENTIAGLTAHKPTEGCVIDCGVECKTAKLQFTRRAKELRAEVEAIPEGFAPIPTEYTPREILMRAIRDLTAEKAAYEGVQRTNQQREAIYDRVTKELETLPDTAAQEQAVAALKERINKGTALRFEVQEHWRAVEAMKTAETTRQALQTDVNRLEELVQTLGPNGARVQALQESLGRFETAVNAFTTPFGWTIAFSADPWEVTANGRNVHTYSKSEQFRIGIAVQLAIAHLSGLSFAIVDELDMLDAANRATMTALLLKAGLDQVIILATREPSQPLPVGPGIIAYRLALEKGRTVLAERSAA